MAPTPCLILNRYASQPNAHLKVTKCGRREENGEMPLPDCPTCAAYTAWCIKHTGRLPTAKGRII